MISERVMFVRGAKNYNPGALMFGLPLEPAPGRSWARPAGLAGGCSQQRQAGKGRQLLALQ